ncbi:hypothetical protein [Bombilactobacillus bombi]|uniref:hypothetical protein n=1 Tax=Bombilactobacillus bombi TaxID=1303590 RepID=UPI00196901D1|nr:hypothetical protein [Bombilactobacillus bombi]
MNINELLLSKIDQANQQQTTQLASVIKQDIVQEKSTSSSPDLIKRRLMARKRALERDY